MMNCCLRLGAVAQIELSEANEYYGAFETLLHRLLVHRKVIIKSGKNAPACFAFRNRGFEGETQQKPLEFIQTRERKNIISRTFLAIWHLHQVLAAFFATPSLVCST
ncbi:hypothetical protein AB1N83_004999 [Pleurotus pulmonarius]